MVAALTVAATLIIPSPSPALACTGFSCTRGTPTLNPTDLPRPTLTKVAILGDSFSSGEGSGLGSYPKTPSGDEDFRHQSNYSAQALAWRYLANGHRPTPSDDTVFPWPVWTGSLFDTLQFLASSGADTNDLTHPQMDGATVRAAPQLDALDPGTNLIYFGFGGNDAHYASLLTTAILSTDPEGIGWRAVQTDEVRTRVNELLAVLPGVTNNIANALAVTWERAPNAQFVVSLYPIGVKPTGNPDIKAVAGTALDAMYFFAQSLNAAIRDGVTRFQADHPGAPRIRIFDPNTAGPGGTSLVAGHELGQPQSYFNGLTIRFSDIPKIGGFRAAQESFHPNQFAGVAIGQALAAFTAAEFPDLFPRGYNTNHIITNPAAYTDVPISDADLAAWRTQARNDLCASGQGTGDVCSAPAGPGTGGGGGGSGGGVVDYPTAGPSDPGLPPDPGVPDDPGYPDDPGEPDPGAGNPGGGGGAGGCEETDPDEMCTPDEPQQ
ncbi:hypothetical protein [Dactylosporangium sp. CA-092794]|uniref:hypothetical protein n=1 Tax=Dactylosporangium sp. CA-092794 TaxID=3239929 RepID=UPI003D92CB1F